MRMQHLFAVVLFIIAAGHASAQAILTSDEMAPPGTTTNYKTITDLSVLDTTIQGASAVWDFSDITAPGAVSLSVTIRTPAQTPYAAQFPTANYAYQETPTAYRYFNLTPALMERVGSYFTGVNQYQDPQIEYVFPLQLGTTSSDTWANTNSDFDGTYGFTCIGTGTLITPSGTWEDALMLRITIYELDEYQAYFWYSSQDGSILLQYLVGDNIFFPLLGRYMSSMSTVGLEENELIADLRYVNPVTDHFELLFTGGFDGAVQVDVLNNLGQPVRSVGVRSQQGQSTRVELDAEGLAAGVYQVRLLGENARGVRTVTFVKQ